MTESGQGHTDFGVYVHWPFCQAKCPYCDFNSHVRHAPIDQMKFAGAIVRELGHFAQRTPGRIVRSIFFGGGTPSLMEPSTVEFILRTIHDLWSVAKDAEITLEANPTSVEASRFQGYRTVGVNRVSLGVQALDDTALKSLGRLHTTAEAIAAFEIARASFDRVSFDLIYSRSGQTTAEWTVELARALELAVDHLSLYQLTIEPGTRFHDLHRRGLLQVPDDDAARDHYDATQEVCEKAGLGAYEISNHARPGAQCRHNLVYWRYGEYAAAGPGAHARYDSGDNRVATMTERHPETWSAKVQETGHGITNQEVLGRQEQADEMLLMGLRLHEGIDLVRYESLAGKMPDSETIDTLVGDGYVARLSNTRIGVTARGRPVLNRIIAELAV